MPPFQSPGSNPQLNNLTPWQARSSGSMKNRRLANPKTATSKNVRLGTRGGAPGGGGNLRTSPPKTPWQPPPRSPSPVAPSVVGSGATAKTVSAAFLLKASVVGVGLYALVEGLFAKSAGRGSAVSELGFDPFEANAIDPALLYPPSTQTLDEGLPPPFSGGQSYNVYYYVEGSYQTANNRNLSSYDGSRTRTWSTSSRGATVPGQIQGAEFADLGFGQVLVVTAIDQRGYTHQVLAGQTGTGNFIPLVGGNGDYGAGRDNYANGSGVSITRTFRADGQADTGGDPPPERPPLESEPPPPLNLSPIPLKASTGTANKPPERLTNNPVPPPPVRRAVSPPPSKNLKDNNPGGKQGKADNSESPKIDTSPTNKANKLDRQIPSSSPGSKANKQARSEPSQKSGAKTTNYPSPTPEKTKKGIPIDLSDGSKTGQQIADDNPDLEPVKQTPPDTEIDKLRKIKETIDDFPDVVRDTILDNISEVVRDTIVENIPDVITDNFPEINLDPEQIKGSVKDGICESVNEPDGCLNSLKQDEENDDGKTIDDKLNEICEALSVEIKAEIKDKICQWEKDGKNKGEVKEIVCQEKDKAISYDDKGLTGLHEAIKSHHLRLDSLHKDICAIQNMLDRLPEPIATIPHWWQVRAGSNIPQLVVIYQEKDGDSFWSLSIPHYNGGKHKGKLKLIPSYTKGNYSTILYLSDNSKVFVNTKTKGEGESVIKRLSTLISGEALTDSIVKSGGERRGKALKEVRVIPAYAKYFSTGQKNLLPDWSYNFKRDKFS